MRAFTFCLVAALSFVSAHAGGHGMAGGAGTGELAAKVAEHQAQKQAQLAAVGAALQGAMAQKQAAAAEHRAAKQERFAALMSAMQGMAQEKQARWASYHADKTARMQAAGAQLAQMHADKQSRMQAAVGAKMGMHSSSSGAAASKPAAATATPAAPEMEMEMAAEPAPEPSEASCSTVAATAASVPELSILVEAVTAAGGDVVGILSDPEAELTVFAPTNDAFAAVLEAFDVTKEQLFSNATLLTSLLSYHVVPAAVKSTALTNGQEIETLLGPSLPLTVAIDGDTVEIEAEGSTAKVVMADVEACASVVHVIDAVLLPMAA